MREAELDRIDLHLLAKLQRQGRLTNAELAERVHLSPSACLRRVQRLEQVGVLAGYAARIDPGKVGLGLQAFVRVQLARHDPAAVDEQRGNGMRLDQLVMVETRDARGERGHAAARVRCGP